MTAIDTVPSPSNSRTKRNLDIVFCLDATGSMTPIIDSCKEGMKSLYGRIIEAFSTEDNEITGIRVRLIAFRDYGSDGSRSMEASPFYELPADQDDFESRLMSIEATGGGDAPENGLEALHVAFASPWVSGPKDRQVVVLCTDADSLELGERKSCEGYPQDMGTLEDLYLAWDGGSQEGPHKLNPKTSRLICFAPKGSHYEKLCNDLSRSIFTEVDSARGMSESSFDAILKVIVASLS